MDSLLLLGNSDPKVREVLTKLGYALVEPPGETPIEEVVSESMFDLIIVDANLQQNAISVCERLRKEDASKTLPILFIAKNKHELEALGQLQLKRMICFESPVRAAEIAAKVATELRVRKIVGKDKKHKPTLSESNAALRDSNDRFRQEMDDAIAIQLSLLPKKLPIDERFELGTHYRPLEDVGGDWYFVNQLNPTTLGIQVVDVTGHGLAAAFIGTMIKLAISAASKESAEKLSADVNRLVAPVLPAGRFATMGNLFYHPDTGEAHWTSAGHPAAVLIHHSRGAAEQLTAKGYPLGFLDDSEYTSVSGTLIPGDFLVLYSDGLTEAMNRKREIYGTDLLIKGLLSLDPASTAKQIVDSIITTFEQWRDGKMLKDDISVVVLKRR